jgi:hypothetical protein
MYASTEFISGELQKARMLRNIQIGEIRPSTLHQVLRLAAIGFKEPRYRELAFQLGGETPRLELTLP